MKPIIKALYRLRYKGVGALRPPLGFPPWERVPWFRRAWYKYRLFFWRIESDIYEWTGLPEDWARSYDDAHERYVASVEKVAS